MVLTLVRTVASLIRHSSYDDYLSNHMSLKAIPCPPNIRCWWLALFRFTTCPRNSEDLSIRVHVFHPSAEFFHAKRKFLSNLSRNEVKTALKHFWNENCRMKISFGVGMQMLLELVLFLWRKLGIVLCKCQRSDTYTLKVVWSNFKLVAKCK